MNRNNLHLIVFHHDLHFTGFPDTIFVALNFTISKRFDKHTKFYIPTARYYQYPRTSGSQFAFSFWNQMSQTAPTSTTSTTTTFVQQPHDYTVVLQRRPEMVRRNQHIRDNTLHVDWVEGTIDNEHMNKKKSKKCCIFRKPKAFDQSSDESSWEDPDPIENDKPDEWTKRASGLILCHDTNLMTDPQQSTRAKMQPRLMFGSDRASEALMDLYNTVMMCTNWTEPTLFAGSFIELN